MSAIKDWINQKSAPPVGPPNPKAFESYRGGSAIASFVKDIPAPRKPAPPPLPGSDHPFNPRNPDYQKNMDNAMAGVETSFFKNFINSIPESLPLGVGEIIKTANQMSYEDWEEFDNHKATDWTKFTGKSILDTGKEFIKAPVRIAAQVRATATGGKKDTITLPLLGESKAYSGEVSVAVDNGMPTWLAVATQIPAIIFDTLFTAGVAQKMVSPRESTILTGKDKAAIPSTILETPGMKHRSFRLTQAPKPTYVPITETTPDGAWIRSNLINRGKLNPNNPTFLKIEPTGDGLNTKIVQIKPSIANEMLGGSKTPGPIRPATAPKGEIVIEGGKLTPTELKAIAEKAANPGVPVGSPVVPNKVTPASEAVPTLKPSMAKPGKETITEAADVDMPDSVQPFSEEPKYTRPLIGKTEMKTLIANSPEFQAKPELRVNEDKHLEFTGEATKFRIRPEALQVNPSKLKVGQIIKVDPASLKVPKSNQQLRIYTGDKVSGFNPKNLDDLNKPVAREETSKAIKRSEIAKQISEKLNVPIRRGKYNIPGALGIFKHGPKVVRIKKGGLATVFHEVGHFLDDTMGISKDLNIKERKALMEEYGHSYEGNAKKQRQEGFAEYLRFRMTGQAARAEKLAPEFHKKFNEFLKNHPEIKEVIDTATKDYERWHSQPAAAKILSHISIGGEGKGKLTDRVTNSLHNLYTLAKDELHPLSEFSALAKKQGVDVPAETDPYILARNLRGWIGKATTFLERGTFGKDYFEEKDGKLVPKFKGKSYQEIMDPIDKAGKLDDFRVYIVAQRALEKSGQNVATGISESDAKAAIAELEAKNPEFKKASEELRTYREQLMDYAAENGLLGPKALANIKSLNEYYVPFYRVMEEARSAYMGGKKVTGNIPSPVKKMKGSEREIIDPLESDIKNTYAIINAVERNNVGVQMALLAEKDPELGRLFEKVDKPMKPVTVNAGEVLRKAVPELAGMVPPDLADEVVTLFRPSFTLGDNMLQVNFGDKTKVFHVDSDLFKALQGLNAEDTGMIMKILGMPARLLRAGATLSPDFSIRNPLRDQFTAFVYSNYGFIPGVDLIKGIFHVFNKGPVYDLWRMGGGEHSMLVSMDRDYLQKGFKELMRSNKATALHYITHPIDALRVVSELGEQATRLSEMSRALKHKAHPVKGAFSSREVTLDFARIGAKTKALNNIIAFWNAHMEGLDRMVRSFKDKPFRTLWKVLVGITLPSILLYLANRNDPRWKEIPAWQKDLFWIVMTEDHIYRIPKPFELGILFGSVPERIMEFIDNNDPDVFNQLEKSILDGATPGFLPTAIVPFVENWTNYSFFLDRPIVGQGKEDLPPEAQYNPNTSELSKEFGDIIGYSPAKIDNLIQGYTGGLGKYVVSTVDKVLEGTGVVHNPPEPTTGLEDLPVLKAFMVRPPVGSSSESVNRIYDKASVINGQAQFVKNLVKEGKQEEAAQYVKDHPEIAYTKLLTAVLNDFSDINKARDAIISSETLTPEEKKQKIDELNNLQTKVAQRILEEMR